MFSFWGIRTRGKNNLHSFRYYFLMSIKKKENTHTIAEEREREK
jgi:hypothetical protein